METKDDVLREIKKFSAQWNIPYSNMLVYGLLCDLEGYYGFENKETLEQFYKRYTEIRATGNRVCMIEELGYH